MNAHTGIIAPHSDTSGAHLCFPSPSVLGRTQRRRCHRSHYSLSRVTREPGPGHHPNTTLYTYRFCIFVFFRAPVPYQVPGPPGLHKYKLSRGVPGACPGPRDRVPVCPGVVCPGVSPGAGTTMRVFFILAFWGFIPGDVLALDFLGSGFCLGGALAYRGSIPPGAAVS